MENSDYGKNNGYYSQKETFYGVGSFLLEIVKIFFLALIIITPIRVFLLQPFFVQGASMEPNFDDNQYLIVNELGYKQTNVAVDDLSFFSVTPFKELHRGDVVVFRYPIDPRQYFIKRVIGLPGEKVEITNGKVIIYDSQNPKGFILNESDYLSPEVRTNTSGNPTLQLGPDEYFVMGDNRSASHDSRAWGPLNKSFVTGKVLLRAWPFQEAQVF